MPDPTDAYDTHMRAYRGHLHRLNRVLAEDYIRQNSHHLFMAIDELAKAAPVALAIAQLHECDSSMAREIFLAGHPRNKGRAPPSFK